MEDMLCLALGLLGLMSTFNGHHLDTAVYEEGPHAHRLSFVIPGYHDAEHLRHVRRRERAKERRAEAFRWQRCR
jgi:hypothetical protein